MRRQGGSVVLNIAGLAIGLTSFLFITLYVINELSYDRFHKNYENIYRVKVVGRMSGGVIDQAITAAPMAQAMLKDYPEVLVATRVRGMGAWLIRFGDKRYNEDGILFAESNFFDVFDFKLLRGDPGTALVQPRSMILTEEFSKKYFGNQDPMGQRMSVEEDTILYTVTGVIQDIPDNSHIKFDMLASLSTYPGMANSQFWLNHNFYTYIVVREGVGKSVLEEKFQGMVIKYVGPQIQEFIGLKIDDFRKAGNDFKYVLEPLKDIHLKGAPQYNLEPPGSIATVYIFAVIALMILVIAIINYVNLATAKSASRAKEVGVKKVAGVYKSGLVMQ
jgi:putative ABC transport system permease protein